MFTGSPNCCLINGRIEERIMKREDQVRPTEQARFLFRRDAEGVESYQLGIDEEARWVDEKMIEEHIAQYKREGMVIFVPIKNN